MKRLILATIVSISGIVWLNCAVPVKRSSGVPDLETPLEFRLEPFAQPSREKGDIRHTFPDTWREIRFPVPGVRMAPGPQTAHVGRLVVTPRVGIGPLAIRVLWHVPAGLHGIARLTATQTDIDPPMVADSTSRDLQGRAETIEARWQLPPGLWDVSGCVASKCLRRAVVVS